MQESVPRDTRRLGLLPLHTAPNLHFTCTLCLHSPGDSDHPLTCPNPSPLLVHRVLLLLCSGCPKPTMKSRIPGLLPADLALLRFFSASQQGFDGAKAGVGRLCHGPYCLNHSLLTFRASHCASSPLALRHDGFPIWSHPFSVGHWPCLLKVHFSAFIISACRHGM